MLTKIKQQIIDTLFKIAQTSYEDLKKYSPKELSQIVEKGSGDVIYKVDDKPEQIVDKFFNELSQETSFLGISEKTGAKVYGSDEPKYFIITDPLDGSRHQMYQLQDTAFSLMALGKLNNKTQTPRLKNIEFCTMLQIPNSDKKYIDLVISEKEKGTKIERYEVDTWEKKKTLKPTPSKEETIENGFIGFTTFFYPRKYLAEICDYVIEKALPKIQKGIASVFFHEYISNAGQFYYLLTGKYRMIADLRPLQEKVLENQNKILSGRCAHPYDVCCALALKETNCVITDGFGNEENFWNYPCDTTTNVHFMAFANKKIYEEIAPLVVEAMEKLWWKK